MKKQNKGFIDDKEKMLDFLNLSKEEFLKSYSYLTEKEYKATEEQIKERLSYLRKQIEEECISYGEIAELQSLKDFIEGDVLLLEWAGVPEFEKDKFIVVTTSRGELESFFDTDDRAYDLTDEQMKEIAGYIEEYLTKSDYSNAIEYALEQMRRQGKL